LIRTPLDASAIFCHQTWGSQVASHAQKYFIRLNCANKKDKRRASIHDITCASLPELHARHAGLMAGQLSG
jgi:hypothetical protein